jgi:hypothetical protein
MTRDYRTAVPTRPLASNRPESTAADRALAAASSRATEMKRAGASGDGACAASTGRRTLRAHTGLLVPGPEAFVIVALYGSF